MHRLWRNRILFAMLFAASLLSSPAVAQGRIWGVGVGEAVTIAAGGGAPGTFVAHKFGHNETTASGDVIASIGGAYPYLSYTGTALAMRVKAGGHAADTAAGDGCREVTIQGLDGDFLIASEAVATAGASASSATTALFSRVLRLFCSAAGANRINTANIIIEDSAGAASYAQIDAAEGQSAMGFVTVPAGYRGMVTDISISTDLTSGTGYVAVTGFRREGGDTATAPFPAKRIFWRIPAISKSSAVVSAHLHDPIIFDEKTDIWFDAVPSGGTPEVDVSFTVLFEKL